MSGPDSDDVYQVLALLAELERVLHPLETGEPADYRVQLNPPPVLPPTGVPGVEQGSRGSAPSAWGDTAGRRRRVAPRPRPSTPWVEPPAPPAGEVAPPPTGRDGSQVPARERPRRGDDEVGDGTPAPASRRDSPSAPPGGQVPDDDDASSDPTAPPQAVRREATAAEPVQAEVEGLDALPETRIAPPRRPSETADRRREPRGEPLPPTSRESAPARPRAPATDAPERDAATGASAEAEALADGFEPSSASGPSGPSSAPGDPLHFSPGERTSPARARTPGTASRPEQTGARPGARAAVRPAVDLPQPRQISVDAGAGAVAADPQRPRPPAAPPPAAAPDDADDEPDWQLDDAVASPAGPTRWSSGRRLGRLDARQSLALRKRLARAFLQRALRRLT